MPEVGSGDGWSIAQDRQGLHKLGLRGPWSDSIDRALREAAWDRVSLQAVEWNDYTPLLPFRERLQRLAVFDGPSKVAGLDQLDQLTDLDLLQARLSAAPQLELLGKLARLEIFWKKGIAPAVLSLPELRHLLIAAFPWDDLTVVEKPSVAWLELREGSIRSTDSRRIAFL